MLCPFSGWQVAPCLTPASWWSWMLASLVLGKGSCDISAAPAAGLQISPAWASEGDGQSCTAGTPGQGCTAQWLSRHWASRCQSLWSPRLQSSPARVVPAVTNDSCPSAPPAATCSGPRCGPWTPPLLPRGCPSPPLQEKAKEHPRRPESCCFGVDAASSRLPVRRQNQAAREGLADTPGPAGSGGPPEVPWCLHGLRQ